MKVRITKNVGKNEKPYKDGAVVFTYTEGQQVDVPDDKAQQLVERGLADPLDAHGRASSAITAATNRAAAIEQELDQLRTKAEALEKELEEVHKQRETAEKGEPAGDGEKKGIEGVPPTSTMKTPYAKAPTQADKKAADKDK